MMRAKSQSRIAIVSRGAEKHTSTSTITPTASNNCQSLGGYVYLEYLNHEGDTVITINVEVYSFFRFGVLEDVDHSPCLHQSYSIANISTKCSTAPCNLIKIVLSRFAYLK